MRVLIIETVINLPWCMSLKDKRKIRRGLIDRLQLRYRVSAKEIDCQDVWKTQCLGIAAVVISETGGRELEASIHETVLENCNGEIREWNVDLI